MGGSGGSWRAGAGGERLCIVSKSGRENEGLVEMSGIGAFVGLCKVCLADTGNASIMIGCTHSFDCVPFYSKRKEPKEYSKLPRWGWVVGVDQSSFPREEGYSGGIVLKVTSFCPKETTENLSGQRNRDDRGVCGPTQGKGTHGHRIQPPKHQKVKTRGRII